MIRELSELGMAVSEFKKAIRKELFVDRALDALLPISNRFYEIRIKLSRMAKQRKGQ
jgi:hypothetical protein